jgi:hypothetical protein
MTDDMERRGVGNSMIVIFTNDNGGEWLPILEGRAPEVERHDLASRRQDIAQKLQPLLADWERDVDAEAKGTAEQSAASMKR